MLQEQVRICFGNLGIVIDNNEQNIQLSEYIEDSLTYISFLVELEQTFGIDIPDDYLMQGSLESFLDVCNMIENLVGSMNGIL